MVKGFSKIYNLSFFGHLFLLTFVQYNWIFQKKFIFCKIAHFFVDYKIRAQELFNDVSFVIIGHQTRDLEGGGGGQIRVSWFSSTPAGIGLKKSYLAFLIF